MPFAKLTPARFDDPVAQARHPDTHNDGQTFATLRAAGRTWIDRTRRPLVG
jgi:hypothetical protein